MRRTILGLAGALLMNASFAASLLTAKAPDLGKVDDTSIEACTDRDRQIAYAPEAVTLLMNYGFNLNQGIWTCKRLQAQWLHNGTVLALHMISQKVDTGADVTLLAVSREPRLWVVPVSSGMIQYPNLSDEIHNKAAFNALIAENEILSLNPERWLSLALYYMNMVGVEVHIVDWKAHGETIYGLTGSPEFFHKKGLTPTVLWADDQCTVTISDTRTTAVTQTFTVWTLSFSKSKAGIRLDDVEHKIKRLSELP